MATMSRLNHLLTRLPPADQQRLVRQGEVVTFHHVRELYPNTGPIAYVYFPLTLVASVMIGAGDNGEVAIVTIGNEGMIGSAVVLGVPRAWGRTVVQVSGAALQLPVATLTAFMARQPLLHTVLALYQYVLTRHMAQLCVCNHLHSMQERCARWLLMTQDRAGRDAFGLTQQFLARMMGVRRATVNLVLGLFKRAGLITYVRGRMQILDRAGLEALTCPCYAIIQTEYERVSLDMSS